MPKSWSWLVIGLLGGVTACTPRMTIPQTQIQSHVQVEGHLITVTLTNSGPEDLMLKNDCPRPFGLTVQDGSATLRPYQTCIAKALPPLPWRVGEKISASLEFNLQPGLHSMTAQASMSVRLASQPKSDFKTMQVNIPAFQVNVQ